MFSSSQYRNKKFGEVMKSLLSNIDSGNKNQDFIKKNTEFIKKAIEDILSLSPEERQRRFEINDDFDESKPLYDAASLLSAEINVPKENIHIFNEDDVDIFDPNRKAKYSRPFKPAIFLQ
jgi:leucyl-tRNA synthetase